MIQNSLDAILESAILHLAHTIWIQGSHMYLSIFVFVFAILFSGDVYAQKSSQFSMELKRCDSGEFDSCHAVGLAFQNGKGVKQDYKKAMKFFEESCKGENQSGCAAIAAMHVKA